MLIWFYRIIHLATIITYTLTDFFLLPIVNYRRQNSERDNTLHSIKEDKLEEFIIYHAIFREGALAETNCR